MAKIVEERIAEPDDPIYQTGWYIVHLVHLEPKKPLDDKPTTDIDSKVDKPKEE